VVCHVHIASSVHDIIALSQLMTGHCARLPCKCGQLDHHTAQRNFSFKRFPVIMVVTLYPVLKITWVQFSCSHGSDILFGWLRDKLNTEFCNIILVQNMLKDNRLWTQQERFQNNLSDVCNGEQSDIQWPRLLKEWDAVNSHLMLSTLILRLGWNFTHLLHSV
jgi:hypothetical protein